MKTLTSTEATDWCKDRGVYLSAHGRPIHDEDSEKKCRFDIAHEDASRSFWISKYVEASIRPWNRCLLWVNSWGIWPSAENWHMYYRLRQTYGDYRLLDETPGHLFFEYETSDLVTFFQIAILSGWDASLITSEDYVRAFVSHHQQIEFSSKNPLAIDALNSELPKFELKPSGAA